MKIRDYQKKDEDFVLECNRVNVEVLSPMDAEKLDYFRRVSELFQVVELSSGSGVYGGDEPGESGESAISGEPAAFLIALREGIPDYTSENYIWFSQQYDKFLYVDRIVIDERYRGRGIGRDLYEGVFEHARKTGVPVVTAEIDIRPYNEPSLKFHEEMGFEEVGQQVIRGGEIEVSLQARPVL